MSNMKDKGRALVKTFRMNHRAMKLWWREMPAYVLILAGYNALEALSPYVTIYFAARILDALASTGAKESVIALVALSLGITFAVSVIKGILERAKDKEQRCQGFVIEKLYAQKLFSMDFHIVDDPHTHDLRSQIFQNANWAGYGADNALYVTRLMFNAIVSIVGAAALSVTLFTSNVSTPQLAFLDSPLFIAVLAALLIAATFISPALLNKANAYFVKMAEQVKFTNRLIDFFASLPGDRQKAKDVRIYRQDTFCALAFDRTHDMTSLMDKYGRGPMGGYGALSTAVSGIFMGLVYVFVCLKAWAGAFGVGAVTQYVGAVTALAGGVSLLLQGFGEMKVNAEFLDVTFEYLDMPNDMYQGSLTVEKRADRKYEIEFRDVSFKYPSSDAWALRHVSFKFRVGERLAVVGRNGSGKTTFIKLLCRLYDPTEGEILLNGINIKKYDYQEYMSIFSVVFQDFKLLAFSLGENVASRIEYDRDRAEDCLIRAGLGDRLKTMPQGLDTILYKEFDKEGVEISGGEAQKIAIARALYKDAPFMILDEPTASLDPVAEFEIYSKFNEIVTDCTAVYISHRLASCRFLDDIAVFVDGSIAERGTHEQLLCAGGEYAQLWSAQAQYYNGEEFHF